MKAYEHIHECNEALSTLVGKKILDILYKPYNDNCWRLYITTSEGKVVMTFCRDWVCPEVELRYEKES